MDLEKILEGLSREEKLALLERLVRGEGKENAAAAGKTPSVEERLERLEQQAGEFPSAPWEAFRRSAGAYPWELCCGGMGGPRWRGRRW
jgi:hypothetical protein